MRRAQPHNRRQDGPRRAAILWAGEGALSVVMITQGASQPGGGEDGTSALAGGGWRTPRRDCGGWRSAAACAAPCGARPLKEREVGASPPRGREMAASSPTQRRKARGRGRGATLSAAAGRREVKPVATSERERGPRRRWEGDANGVPVGTRGEGGTKPQAPCVEARSSRRRVRTRGRSAASTSGERPWSAGGWDGRRPPGCQGCQR